ncbi:MAG: hypothetical protein AAF928_02235 [Myxococcota bacterium]
MTSKADQELDALITEITVGTSDDGASTRAMFERIKARLKPPTVGNCLGHRVYLEAVEFENPRRGIVAVVKLNGRLHRVSLLDVLVAGRSKLAKTIRAYQRWAGAPTEPEVVTISHSEATGDALEAAVLKVGDNAARIRPLGSERELTFRGDIDKLVPGHIVTLKVRKRWSHRAYGYVSGDIEGVRIDIPALGLPPLGLELRGPMSPLDGEPFEEELVELTELIGTDSKPAFELERVMPGVEPHDWETNPIADAVALRDRGQHSDARKAIMGLLHLDLRALSAHSCLGYWALDMQHEFFVEQARDHFEVAVGIVEHRLGSDFDGFVPWMIPKNRPFLRCLQGRGLALWRLGHTDEALRVFERICCLNPMDNTGSRHCWWSIKQGKPWTPGI